MGAIFYLHIDTCPIMWNPVDELKNLSMKQRRKNVCGYQVVKIGEGVFGEIYGGITGQDVVNFLIELQSGEVCGAFHHPEIGPIDLVWGSADVVGYGLAKIVRKHPDVISTLVQKIFESKIIERLPARVVLLMEDGTQRAVVDLQWIDQPKTWLVTAYIPIK